jgi:hypothetical protein
MVNSEIAILSTVINFELYHKSSDLFPRNVQKYVIDGTNGMHGIHSIVYMMEKLKGKNIEWLIMADEDVLFNNSDLVFDIINRMKSENYTVCGIRDGGLISHRKYNPYLINTFFSIINFKEIETMWDKQQMLKNSKSVKNEFQDDLSNLTFELDKLSDFEPYYCFYLWLRRRNKKFLFLDVDQPLDADTISNAVYFDKKRLLYHTWYARSYGINEKHTNRINKVFDLLNFENEVVSVPIVFKDRTFYLKQELLKLIRRVKQKLERIAKNQ